jgi:membrane protease YdiL (CAAX protease family)
MWNFDYKAHRFLTQPAEDKSELWRLVVGLLIGTAIALFLYGLYFTVVFGVSDAIGISVDAMGNTAMSVVVFLLGFGAFCSAIFLVVLTLHRRPIGTIFGPAFLVIPQFAKVCIGMLLLFLAVLVLPPWGYGDPLVSNMALGKWLAILPLTLLAVFVQTSTEEILFRGYIQQQLAARFKSPLVWMILPAALFGLMHYDPVSAGENAVTVVIWAFVFGLVTADLTARSGSLGPAIALHFINNVSALLIVSIPGQLDGAALYVLPFGLDDVEQMRAWLPVDFVLICVSWLVARLAIRA